MGETGDIGRRVELLPMDPHFHEITIALYRQEGASGPAFRVHTYSRRDGAAERIAGVRRAMVVLGGMEETREGLLRFPCGAEHAMACRRLFLEACKLDPQEVVRPRPMTILDKKSGLEVTVSHAGNGVYRVAAEGEHADRARRVEAIAGGLMKLGEMAAVEGASDHAGFSCGHAHDALVGVLLLRAPNVRAVLREHELAASRGVLAAPSQQR